MQHPFAGDWDLFHEEACALGTCKSKGVGCPPTAAFTCTAGPGNTLTFSDFESGILTHPMSDEDIRNYDMEEVEAEDGAPVEVTFSAVKPGCGIHYAVIGLTLVPGAGGAPRRRVRTTYSLELAPLFLRKGHRSINGEVDLYIVRRGEPAKLAAKLHQSTAAKPGAAAAP